MSFVNILKIAAYLFVFGILIFVFYKIFRNIVLFIKEKNYKWLINNLLFAVLGIIICILLIKPCGMLDKFIKLFN